MTKSILTCMLAVLAVLFTTAGASAQKLVVPGRAAMKAPGQVLVRWYGMTSDDLEIGPPATAVVNGVEFAADSVVCPDVSQILPLYSVLAIDVSGSMARGAPNMRLAQEAARAWVRGLTDGSSCAITTFDNRHYLNVDATSDTTQLLNVVANLKARGGTSYQEGLLGEPFGALRIAASGGAKRVVVFLTDGAGTVAVKDVVAYAEKHNVLVFCVSLGMSMPQPLRTISESTGGTWFENINTISQAVAAYKQIALVASAAQPCTAIVKTNQVCSTTFSGTLRLGVDEVPFSVEMPASMFSLASIQTSQMNVGVVPANTWVPLDVSINAGTHPQSIIDAQVLSPKSAKVRLADSTVVIPPNTQGVVRIEISVPDTTSTVITAVLKSDQCSMPPVYIVAGNQAVPPSTPTLRVVYPNGGEKLNARSSVILKYDGIPPNQPVSLEISLDKGQTWTVLSTNAKGGSLPWSVPDTTSNDCLLRVSQITQTNSTRGALARLFSVANARDITSIGEARYLAASSTSSPTEGRQAKSTVTIWDASTGSQLHAMSAGSFLMALPDGASFLAWGDGALTRIDAQRGNIAWRTTLPSTSPIRSVSTSSNGRTILVVGGWGDSTLVLSGADGSRLTKIPRVNRDAVWATISPQGTVAAVCDVDSALNLYSIATGDKLRTVRASGSRMFYRAVFSPDGSTVAASDGNGTTSLYTVKSGKMYHELSRRQYVNDNTYIAFSADGNRIAVETGQDQTKIFDVRTGGERVTIQRRPDGGPVSNAFFSPDGSILALTTLSHVTLYDASSGVQVAHLPMTQGTPQFSTDSRFVFAIADDKTIASYALRPAALQTDVSDAVWSIVRAIPNIADIRFAPRRIGSMKDSVVRVAIVNTGNADATVVRLAMEGQQASDFSVRTGTPLVVRPGDTISLEVSFHPQGVGERACKLVAELDNRQRIDARVTGRALKGFLDVTTANLNFGSVPLEQTAERFLSKAITNTGSTTLTVRSVRRRGPDDSSFAIMSPSTFRLAPGESHTVHAAFHPVSAGRRSVAIEFDSDGADEPLVVMLYGTGGIESSGGGDPTTFRSIMLPTAIVPAAGTITTGLYDAVGLATTASVTDYAAVMVGGALPVSSRWVGARGFEASIQYAWSVGAKVGWSVANDVVVGGGVQHGASIYDQDFSPDLIDSKITFTALWTTVGIGNDDSRANFYLGYALKYHETAFLGNFNADATIIGAAWDTRISDSWKICTEAFFMRTMPFVPVTVTARYFGETYALEAGITIAAIPASGQAMSKLPVIPMLTWVKRW